ncbi:hypothetical protein MNBD_GAMMA23-1620 [hydrothermal vent metagenome]|uniref:Uncharacterized protein n=1 Tax=hydrothermal vent metagenome TaxID=652676 RepID=A0A3B0ZYU6_9ZZZZ
MAQFEKKTGSCVEMYKQNQAMLVTVKKHFVFKIFHRVVQLDVELTS